MDKWMEQFEKEFLKRGGLNTPDSLALAKIIARQAYLIDIPPERAAHALADFQLLAQLKMSKLLQLTIASANWIIFRRSMVAADGEN